MSQFKELTVRERFMQFFQHPSKDLKPYTDIFYCRKGGHWLMREDLLQGISGRQMCPIHHQPVRLKKVHAIPIEVPVISINRRK